MPTIPNLANSLDAERIHAIMAFGDHNDLDGRYVGVHGNQVRQVVVDIPGGALIKLRRFP
jgi:hypothetical protein